MTSIRLVNNNPLSRLHSVFYYLLKDDRLNTANDSTSTNTGHYCLNR